MQQQEVGELGIAVHARMHERGDAGLILRVRRGTLAQEQPHHVQVLGANRERERRVALWCGRINLRREHMLDGREISIERRNEDIRLGDGDGDRRRCDARKAIGHGCRRILHVYDDKGVGPLFFATLRRLFCWRCDAFCHAAAALLLAVRCRLPRCAKKCDAFCHAAAALLLACDAFCHAAAALLLALRCLLPRCGGSFVVLARCRKTRATPNMRLLLARTEGKGKAARGQQV